MLSVSIFCSFLSEKETYNICEENQGFKQLCSAIDDGTAFVISSGKLGQHVNELSSEPCNDYR